MVNCTDLFGSREVRRILCCLDPDPLHWSPGFVCYYDVYIRLPRSDYHATFKRVRGKVAWHIR